MNIPKAIEIASETAYRRSFTTNEHWFDAITLLIEAGKEVQKAREGDPALDGELLPGETEP